MSMQLIGQNIRSIDTLHGGTDTCERVAIPATFTFMFWRSSLPLCSPAELNIPTIRKEILETAGILGRKFRQIQLIEAFGQQEY